jgi:CBS domain-containing protein
MYVQNILAAKGDRVDLISAEATVSAAIDALAVHDVGALVVSDDGTRIDGILSERDVARGLRTHGSGLLDRPVGQIMTTEVTTCHLDDTISEVMAVMTNLRRRHLPVVVDDLLVGIVSIGDVVKRRVDELEVEHDQMVNYIQGR